MRIKLHGYSIYFPVLILLAIESVLMVVACRMAYWVIQAANRDLLTTVTQATVLAIYIVLAGVGMGLYSRRQRDRLGGLLLRVSICVLLGAIAAKATFMFTPQFSTHPYTLLQVTGVAWLVLASTRAVSYRLLDQDLFRRRVLIYGAGEAAKPITLLRRRSDQRGFRLLGFVAVNGETPQMCAELLVPLRGSLLQTANALGADEVVIAMADRRGLLPMQDLLQCRMEGIEISEVATFLERESGKVSIAAASASWIVFSDGFQRDLLRMRTQRAFSLLASLVILVITAPILLLTAIAIKLEDGWRAPVLYSQYRVGMDNKRFNMLKFRSMSINAEENGVAQWASENDPRVTRVGSFIRKSHIDELPQIFNVLSGDMSFVGPRPERPEFVDQLAARIPYYSLRHSVKPGIAGWAQLCFPYGASEQDAIEKLQYDLYYVKNHSLVFDVSILLQTLGMVFITTGAR
jgi:sugar transferase (PEP-CTERM system associated)